MHWHGLLTNKINIMTSERIKEIQQETAYPNSVSVQQALLKVWNECEQERVKNCSIPAVVGRSEQLVCDCPSETFAKHYKGDGKCGYCGGKAES